MSFSEVSEAEPRSQIFKTAFDSLTCNAPNRQQRQRAETSRRLTRMLSGLISACMISHFRSNDNPRNICDAYARTALRLIPTSFPNRLTTSRRFMLCQKNRQR